jgi:NADH:ubiquinone oxidoreductase subunit 6 (subunit J)
MSFLSPLLLIWLVGAVFGLFIFISFMIDESIDPKYWYLFTVLWPLGLLVFILWAIIQTYRLVIHITSQQ